MNFTYITSLEDGIQSLKSFEKDKYLYLDTEVDIKNFDKKDFYKDRIRLIQIGNEEKIYIYDLFKIGEKFIPYLKDLLESKGIIGHNLKFDIKFLFGNFSILPKIVFDTMIASQLLNAGLKNKRYSLSNLYFDLFQKNLDKTEQKSDWGSPILTDKQIEYAGKDIQVLREIFKKLRKKINDLPYTRKGKGEISQTFDIHHPVFAIEMYLVPILSMIEIVGIPIDVENLKKELEKLRKSFEREYINFVMKYNLKDINDDKAIKNWLKNRLKIIIKDKSVKEKELLKYKNKYSEIENLIRLKKIKREKDTLENLLSCTKDGRVYSEFIQVATTTGRIYTRNPNIQNIPRALKRFIKAPEGKKLIIGDYSQIELRIVAEYKNEEKMIQAFKNKKDLHRYTASLIFKKEYSNITKEERQIAKAVNFGIIYGMSPKSLRTYIEQFEISITEEEAKRFQKEFFNSYPKLKEWHTNIKKEFSTSRNKIKKVYSMLGRKMFVDKFQDAVNYPIQATGSDILKLAVGFIYKNKDSIDLNIVNLIHDEIIVEVNENDLEKGVNLIKSSMLKAGKMLLKKVPVEIDLIISDRWEH